MTATRSLDLQRQSAHRLGIIADASAPMQQVQERTAQASERSADAAERMATDLTRLLRKMDGVIAALHQRHEPSTRPTR